MIRTFAQETTDLAALEVSDVAKARIGEALAAGYLIVVPEHAVALDGTEQVGWRQVNPRTGRTFDLMENGRGAAQLGDFGIIIGGVVWRISAWKLLSFVMSAIIAFSVFTAITMYPK